MSATVDDIILQGLSRFLHKVMVQKQAHEWEQETFDHTDQNLLRKFKEEFEELCDELEHSGSAECVADEMADVFIIMSMFAERFGVDILAAACQKMEINKKRKWAKDENGSYQRVKETNDDQG